MTEPPLVVVWRVTEYCDLACHFCGYSRALKRPRHMADPEPVLAFGAVLGAYAAQTGRAVLVSWLGGEPLRWPPVWDVSHRFKREFHLQLGVTTNGTALSADAICQRVMKNFDQLTFSVDGLGAFHDEVRGAPGLFEQLRERVGHLRELKTRLGRGPQLRVNTILMRDNFQDFEALCWTLAEWGVEALTFNALGGRDRPEFYQDHALRPAQVAWLREHLPGLRARLAERGLRLYGAERYLDRLASSALGQPIPIDDCQPGQQFLFVDERGLAGPCSATTSGYGVPIAELRAPHDLRALPARLAQRQHDRRLAACADCVSTQVFGKFADLFRGDRLDRVEDATYMAPLYASEV